jgi:hypothetical protein
MLLLAAEQCQGWIASENFPNEGYLQTSTNSHGF